MAIDFDLNELKAQFEKTRQTISELHKSGQTNLKIYEASKKELSLINSELTWNEKYLGGAFGGNKEKVKATQVLKEKIADLRQQLKKVDENLKLENYKVKASIIEYLSKNSQKFKSLVTEKQTSQELHQEIKALIDLLKKAKKGIKDALLFTSWENLLIHPKAKEELGKFNKVLGDLEDHIKRYENRTGANFLDRKRLSELVQFSTEKIAMDCFNTLSNLINGIATTLETTVIKNEKEANALIENIQQAIFG